MRIRNKLIMLLIVTLLLTCLVGMQSSAANYNVSVDISTKYQTLEGFGAAIAWYNNWLTGHPNKNELYNTLFYDMGLDILRLRNQYRYNNNFAYDDAEIVKMAKILNPDLKVFLASWSPPEDLKRDGVMNGGTLKKENGSFVYDKFADYWYDSLIAYKEKGIVPDYISIQNEPDYEDQNWETCILKPTEDQNYPSYGKALDAVYNKIKSLPDMPKILAPEAAGIGFNTVQNYTAGMDLSKVYGIAHHLYNGGDGSNPDSFNSIFKTLAETYPDKPLFQTEYDYGTPFTTAQLIHNSLVVEGVSGYFYWDLIWENAQRPLVFIENPFNPNGWTTEKGYKISDFYYTVQHYAKFTDPGYKRVEATCDSNDIKVTAFVSLDESKLTMIFINNASSQNTVSLDLNGFSYSESAIYRTLENGSEKFSLAGSLSGNTVTLPAKSVVTVALGFDDSATPPPLPTPTPPPTSRSAFELIQAEDYNSMYGISREVISEDGNKNISYIENDDYACYEGIDFGTGATGFEARVSSNTSGGKIEIRLDGPNTQTIATISVPGTGDWNNYVDISAEVSGLTGKHDLYLYFSGGGDYLFNIDSFRFTGGTVPTPTPAGKIGDLNGDDSVDSTDITLMKRYLLRKISDFPVDDDLYAADVNGDDEINSTDLTLLKRYVLRKIDKFPKQ
ncbi:MAG TPA: carbohydrate-binding protein [Acetivibrio sp.]|nr:carbohydrate-binding protein [Acetivibrio sp.]